MAKKQLLLILTFIAALSLLASCGGNGNTVSNDTSATETAGNSRIVIEDPAKETSEAKSTEPAVSEKPEFTFDPDNYTFVQKFPAPEGSPRDIVMDYMLKMSEIEWTPAEDFSITWKGNAAFGVNLSYKSGTVYKGMPYSETNCTYDLFEQYLSDGNTFKDQTYYFEEVVGNHCSGSMVMAYQQIIDLPMTGTLKPTSTRIGLLQFPEDENGETLLVRPSWEEVGDNWVTEDLFKINSKENVYKAYMMLGKSDILYKSVRPAGHTRMVDYVEIEKTLSGDVNYSRSYIACIEQTNAWDRERPGVNSTWYIDHKYTFANLYDNGFMPITLCAFHSDKPLEDAWILFDGENTPESVLEAFNGDVTSNFPINYVRFTLKDASGATVSESKAYHFDKRYSLNIRKYQYDLFNGVPAGTYTFTMRAGIGRGGCDILNFDVTVK